MKDAMKLLLLEKRDYYTKMANMCDEMLSGKSMASVCKANEISVSAFRGRIFKNETRPSSYTSEILLEAINSELNPEERLVNDIIGLLPGKSVALVDFPDDFEETIENLLNELDDRTRDCMYLYYYENWSYTDIGKKYNLSIEWIRQIIRRGIWSLRRSDKKYRIIYGDKKFHEYIEEKKSDYNSKRVKDENSETETSIGILDLRTRTYNTLLRNRVTTIEQVIEMTGSELLQLRNFGKDMLRELDEKLHTNGYQRINMNG